MNSPSRAKKSKENAYLSLLRESPDGVKYAWTRQPSSEREDMVEEVPDTRVHPIQHANTREQSIEKDQKRSTNKYLSEFLKTDKPKRNNALAEEQD